MIHAMIIDSGIGGLSVLAELEHFLASQPRPGTFRLTFANASPEDDYGYNSMPTRKEKLETFDRFLERAYEDYRPDFMYLACNTLAVLFPDTVFSVRTPCPVLHIVQTGVDSMTEVQRKFPDIPIFIFATKTTVQEGAIRKGLQQNGISKDRITAQACPGLADSIAADFSGESSQKWIEKYTSEALARHGLPSKSALVYLGCTHYGYRESMFRQEFERHGIKAICHNPNLYAIEEMDQKQLIGSSNAMHSSHVEIDVVSRYAIPRETRKALSHYLKSVSPITVSAIGNYNHRPDFF
jgi:glutamate racemase